MAIANQQPEKLIIIKDKQGCLDLLAYLQNPELEYVAYDCETTGLDQDAAVVGFSVCAEIAPIAVGYYVVIAYWDKEAKKLVFLPLLEEAKAILRKLKTKSLVTHNGIVDVSWTRVNFMIDLLDAIHTDTMILAHLTDENRPSYGLKELALQLFGESSTVEKEEMQASVIANGGVWENKRGGNKEMYKADVDIIAKYGAKDTILTLKLFYVFIPELFEQGLDRFFFEDESMPQFRTCTYQLNTTGLRVDLARLKAIELDMEKNCARLLEDIKFEVAPYVKDKYPGTSLTKTFNVGATQQLSWLLFVRLGNDWKKLTNRGREKCVQMMGKAPYSPAARKAFMRALVDAGEKSPWKYIQCDKKALMNLAMKYSWVAKILEYSKERKLLTTYAQGIQEKVRYGTIYPSFLQHGTTSGRYSSRAPNFQNLPRDDKRIKSCIVSRPGRSFVGADYSQLEPRTFTAQSQDPILMAGFKNDEDFYSVVGIPLFNKFECIAKKYEDTQDPRCFGKKYKPLRQIAKTICLALAYGTTPYKMSDDLRDEGGNNLSIDQCTKIRDDYFEKYEGVARLCAESHLQIVKTGVVYNQFGRPRRLPEAKIIKTFGFPKSCSASDLPYQYRSLLNLSVNHRVQSTAASIVNRAAIAFCRKVKELGIDAQIILQVHDEIVTECPDQDTKRVAAILKYAMENTVYLNGVDLIAKPVIAKNLADLK